MNTQLPLGIGLQDGARFENFHPGENGAALFALAEASEPFVFLWGAPGSGRSHLLQAACRAAAESGRAAAYLPLAEPGLSPLMLDGMEAMAVVAIDDLQRIAGDVDWETALFHFYNRARDAGCRVLAAADAPPAECGVHLPDLCSRLGWGPTFRLQILDDAGKAAALQLRARRRGLEMPDEVVQFLLRRAPRDPHRLFELLDRLDRASLAAQRRLTVPFVREHLAGAE